MYFENESENTFHFTVMTLMYAGSCTARSNVAACYAQKTIGDCLTTRESRSSVLYGNQIKDSICVWCEHLCTSDNDNKCEPKAFLDGYEKAVPGTVNGYETCLPRNSSIHCVAFSFLELYIGALVS